MTATALVHKDSKAWEAGFKAGKEGKPLNKCPHMTGSIQAKSWHQGHFEGATLRRESQTGTSRCW